MRSSTNARMWAAVKRRRHRPWARALSSVVSISAALILGDFIREGTMSYGHALSIVRITILMAVVLWGGVWLWEE
jgi:hypothetical protein